MALKEEWIRRARALGTKSGNKIIKTKITRSDTIRLGYKDNLVMALIYKLYYFLQENKSFINLKDRLFSCKIYIIRNKNNKNKVELLR